MTVLVFGIAILRHSGKSNFGGNFHKSIRISEHSQSVNIYLRDEDPANLDFETIDFDLGILSQKNSLKRNNVDLEIKT